MMPLHVRQQARDRALQVTYGTSAVVVLSTLLPKQGGAGGGSVGSVSLALEQSDELQGLKNVGKALAIVIGLSAVLVVLWQTGLIIPLGLIGLGISGFLR